MGKMISVFSCKGGVGKTTTAVNLAAAFATSGHKVLLIDCDPQGSAAICAGRFTSLPNQSRCTVFDVLTGTDKADTFTDTCLSLLKVITFPDESVIETYNKFPKNRRLTLFSNMAVKLKSKFDYIIVDNSPANHPITLDGLSASDSVLVPLQCEYLAFKNLAPTMKLLKSVKQDNNPKLKLCGILLTMVDRRSLVTDSILSAARTRLKSGLFKTFIPQSPQLQDSPGFRKPVLVYAPNSHGAQCYKALAVEIIEKSQTHK